MKRIFTGVLLSAALLFPSAVTAQEQSGDDSAQDFRINELYFETRLGFQGEHLDGKAVDDATGFRGQYLNFRLDGQITRGLTYSYRQRLNRNTNQSFFDATDWIHLDWQATPRWGFSAGKQVVAIGGYEYDRAPIDLYYCSEFWNQIPCYQLGVSASCQVAPQDRLLLQVCNSPLRAWSGGNTYAINLMWYGHHGWWETMWSANAVPTSPHRWISYLALGNRFHLGSRLHLDVDWMNRASKGQGIISDMSLMSELSLQAHATTRCFVGYTYDQNKSGTSADVLVLDGTRLHRTSAGVEVSPLRRYPRSLRAFAAVSYNWGTNSNPQDVNQNRQFLGQAGIKFQLDVLQGITRLCQYRNNK